MARATGGRRCAGAPGVLADAADGGTHRPYTGRGDAVSRSLPSALYRAGSREMGGTALGGIRADGLLRPARSAALATGKWGLLCGRTVGYGRRGHFDGKRAERLTGGRLAKHFRQRRLPKGFFDEGHCIVQATMQRAEIDAMGLQAEWTGHDTTDR